MAIKPVDRDINPLDLEWWKANEKKFPTLSLFMKANAAFPPTSLASERLFNKDKQLYGTTRTQLSEDHGEDFVFLHDFLNKRSPPALYQLCPDCPNPPSPDQLQGHLQEAQQVKVSRIANLSICPTL